MNEEMRNLLAKYLGQRNDWLDEANVRPPQGAEPDYNLPQASVQSRGSGAPAVRGEYSMGDLSVRGDFHRPNPQDKPRWGAMLDYRKQF